MDLNSVRSLHDPEIMVAIDAASHLISPQQAAILAKSTNDILLEIIRKNFHTQFATQAPSLSRFREAVSAHGDTEDDATLPADFRTHVPLSDYSPYKPFIDKFDSHPCHQAEVENLLAPGLPNYLATSSATIGTVSKIIPKYNHNTQSPPNGRRIMPDTQGKLFALVRYCGHRSVKEILDPSGRVVQKIPVCISSSGVMRRRLEWTVDDDEKMMSVKAPHSVMPMAASVIDHVPSFLTIHGLFFLACRDVDYFYALFATQAIDLFRRIDEQWDTLVSCIRDGIIPDLEGLGDIRGHLQTHFHADPERAAELLEIGSPSSVEGWAARVWPQATLMYTICSGPYAALLPKLKSILGPTISIHSVMYGASESGTIGIPRDKDTQDEFVLQSEEVVEFLDISEDETHENIRQVWQVEVGKHYEPILTTRDGLWRYQMGDIVSIIGFHPEMNSPIVKFVGRKSLTVQLLHIKIADFQLLEAIMAVSSEDTIRIQEFTTVVDNRMFPPTVGFFVESTGSFGPNASEVRQKLFDALVATNVELQRVLENGDICLPTVRILRAGMFAEYRQWRAKRIQTGSGQTKAPVVLMDSEAHEWILDGVVQEL